MNKDLIEKLLNEQMTPEEEHLLAKMLQQEEDMESWLTEDETEEYYHIVNQRRAKRRFLRWATAAVFVLLIAAGVIVLWPREQVSEDMMAKKERVSNPHKPKADETATVSNSTRSVVTPKKTKKRVKQPAVSRTQDSLEYYIARLEKELDEVTDSMNYTAKAEQIIRADARLQKLIQRIMIGELTKDDQHIESMNITKEEQP